jgi:hypothetical protein
MDFEPLHADFLRITADTVYCTVTTVDPDCRPRSRVMHPIFEVVDGVPRGWALTDRTPLRIATSRRTRTSPARTGAPPRTPSPLTVPPTGSKTPTCCARSGTSSPPRTRRAGATCRVMARPAPPIPNSTSFGFSRIASRSCSATSSPRVTSRLGRGGALIGSRLDASRTESALRWFAGRSGPGTSLAQRTWSTGNAV